MLPRCEPGAVTYFAPFRDMQTSLQRRHGSFCVDVAAVKASSAYPLGEIHRQATNAVRPKSLQWPAIAILDWFAGPSDFEKIMQTKTGDVGPGPAFVLESISTLIRSLIRAEECQGFQRR